MIYNCCCLCTVLCTSWLFKLWRTTLTMSQFSWSVSHGNHHKDWWSHSCWPWHFLNIQQPYRGILFSIHLLLASPFSYIFLRMCMASCLNVKYNLKQIIFIFTRAGCWPTVWLRPADRLDALETLFKVYICWILPYNSMGIQRTLIVKKASRRPKLRNKGALNAHTTIQNVDKVHLKISRPLQHV